VKWDKLVAAAKDALRQAHSAFPPDVVNQLNASHMLRNAVVHRGAVAPSNEARTSISATRRLFDLLPAVATYFKALPDGAGLAGAVAEMLDAPDVAEQLRAGEDAVRTERPTEAANAVARALGLALSRAHPRLGRADSGTEIAFLRFKAEGVDDRIVDLLSATDERLADVEAWTIGAVLGIPPSDFARLRTIAGRWVRFVDSTADRVDHDREATLADASWAVRTVAEVIYRLHETGSWIDGPPDRVWERRRERTGW